MTSAPPPWFEQHPASLESEIQALSEAGFGLTLEEDARNSGQIVFSGEVRVVGKRARVRIEYPDGFPYFRPLIIGPSQLLNRHQNPYTDELCVWPSGEREWDWQLRGAGAKLLQDAIDLIEISSREPDRLRNEEEQLPDPRNLYYPYNPGAHLLIPPGIGTLPIGAYGQALIFGPSRRSPTRGILKRLRIDAPSNAAVEAPASWRNLFAGGGEIAGHWVKLAEPPPFMSNPEEFQTSIASWIAKQHPKGSATLDWNSSEMGWPATKVRLLGVVFPDERKWGEDKQDHWLFVLEWQEPSSIAGAVINNSLLFRTELLDEAVWHERTPGLAGLCDSSVAVCGLGALGSSVALGLGRAGVRKLLVLDRDHIEVGNLVRHEADLRDIGMRKTQAIVQRLLFINPDITVTVANMDFGLAGSLRLLSETLGEFPLVISAFADDAANLVLNRLVNSQGLQQIYSWVGNGAWCGEVLRVVPGKTACFECFCRHMADAKSPYVKFRPTESDEPLVKLANCTSPTFTGTNFDISTLSHAVCRLAVQTLLDGQENGYPNADYNYAAWQFRRATPDQLPAVSYGTIERHPACFACEGAG